MRILIITEGFGKNYYGVEQVLLKLNEQFQLRNVPCRILSASIGDLSNIEVDIKKIPADAFEHLFRWHPAMYHFIIKEMAEFRPDVVHVHGVFTFVQRTAVQAARIMNIPVLWSVHGMLEDWAWQQKIFLYNILKHIYWKFLLYPVFKSVSFVHVITKLESKTLSRYFPRLPQIQIPNVIDFATVPYQSGQLPEKQFVFLGRLHPVKGVSLLIKAFSRAHLEDSWCLIIAGPDYDPEYSRQLRRLVKDLQLDKKIQFVGPVYGDEKYRILQKAWVVVVPSFSEVIALVNLESAAISTPTITTYATGLYDWEEGGGLLVDPKEDQLAQALSKVASWSLDERLKNGEKAHQFVKERYSWDVIVEKWIEAYKTISEEFAKC